MATEPLLGTFITTVNDRDVDGRIHVYYQSKDGSLVREFHDDTERHVDVPPIDQNVAKLYSPLGSIFAIARGTVCNLHTLPLALDTLKAN